MAEDETSELAEGAEVALLELDLGSAKGGRRGVRPQPLHVEVVRELVEADLEALNAPGAPKTGYVPIAQVRTVHHHLAQLLAKGCDQTEAGLITGYSTSYISGLVNHDPAFQELLAHYQVEREQIYHDVLERLRSLGFEATDLIRERLRESPESWTNQQLMDLVGQTLVAPMKATPASGSGSGTPGQLVGELHVTFVSPEAQQAQGVVIEGSVAEVQDDE